MTTKDTIMNQIPTAPSGLIMLMAQYAYTNGEISFAEFEEIQTAVQHYVDSRKALN